MKQYAIYSGSKLVLLNNNISLSLFAISTTYAYSTKFYISELIT